MKTVAISFAISVVALVVGAIFLMPPQDQEHAATTSPLSNVCSNGIPWNDITTPIGESVWVYGPVVNTKYASDKYGMPTYLDIGKGYPAEGRVSVVIWGEHRSKFDKNPEEFYKHQRVCVRGKLETYGGALQIDVESPDAITVLKN